MITYVNTALISNLSSGAMLSSLASVSSADAGKFIMQNMDTEAIITTAADATAAKRIRLGVVNPDGKIKWSNIINQHDVKGLAFTQYFAQTEDTATITFTAANGSERKRILLRVTYMDLPARFRKWTETYEYIAAPDETANSIVVAFFNLLNKASKRNRFTVKIGTMSGTTFTEISNPAQYSTATTLQLVAMPYDDDNSVDSISPANKVRFALHMYYTTPDADGWAASNKYAYTDATIVKTDGKQCASDAKLVRDIEAQAMGYQGILNRGECTWPIIKPAMVTDLSKTYDSLTLEFENMYRAADDIFRKTKQTVNIFGITSQLGTFKSLLDAFVNPITTQIGTLSSLTTTAKSNLVAAINEVNA